MDDFTYPMSLIAAITLAFIFFRNNSPILMLITLGATIYMVYTHETGYSGSDIQDQVVETLDEAIDEYSKSHKLGLSKDED